MFVRVNLLSQYGKIKIIIIYAYINIAFKSKFIIRHDFTRHEKFRLLPSFCIPFLLSSKKSHNPRDCT